jgi:hypothetical protein
MQAAAKFRSELAARLEAAKIFLDIKPAALKATVERVDLIGKEVISAHTQSVASTQQSKPALDLLYEAQKDVKLPKRLILSAAYQALFRN